MTRSGAETHTAPAGNGGAPTPTLSLRGVCKDYGATKALRGVDFDLARGRVHAFVGENGAGKSTCLSVLAGRIAPSAGTVHLDGGELPYGDPRACRHAGVVAIYQELTIVPALSAQANVFLATPMARSGLLREKAMRERYVQICEELDVQPAPDGVPAGQLSVAEQQLLEIMRALVADAKVILFDEPTASLALHEREVLLGLLDRLRSNGVTLVLVSHNLDEILRISDTVTVFREGWVRARGPRAEWDKPRIVREMLGEAAGDRLAREMLEEGDAPPPATGHGRRRSEEPFIRVEGLTVPGAVEDVDLEVRAGEIVGLGGLVGSGRTTVLRALAGLERHATGRLHVDGKRVPIPRTVRRARKLGIALLPEDRKGQGLVMGLDAMTNIALADLGAASRAGFISNRRLARHVEAVTEEFGIASSRVGDAAGSLSGGNQQKLLLARWGVCRPRLLLADEPTRGIDIGAKAEIMSSLERMASEGAGILVVSSELEEVCAISDCIVVLAEGRLVGQLDRQEGDITPSRIMNNAFGLEARNAVA